MMKFFKLWLPVFGWCGLIFYLSGIPQLTTGWGTWDFILRKIAHMIEYFILVFLFYRAFRGSFDLTTFYLILWSFSLSFLYAVSDEIHQYFIPTRYCRVADILIDTAGILAFFILLKYKKDFLEKLCPEAKRSRL